MSRIFTKQLIGPFFLLLTGLLFFAIGSGLTFRQHTLENQGLQTQGTVVNLRESSDSDGTTYAPVVRFNTSNGQSIEFVTSYYSNPPAYEIGEPVIVVYSPDRPEKAIIKGDGQLFHIIFMLVGGVIVAVGSYLMYSTLRNLVSFGRKE